MTLKNLLQAFSDLRCNKVYIKTLAANDNSKNQIYLSRGSAEVLNIFPVKEFIPQFEGKRTRETFFATVDFSWLSTDGNSVCPAPYSKFIVYPDYPEVRFSGFLQGCRNAPNELMTGREQPGRVLFMAVSSDRKVYGYVASADSDLTKEIHRFRFKEVEGVFGVISLEGKKIILDSKQELLVGLKNIYEAGWIESKRLDKNGNLIDCNAPQCGGYTLEAQFGIIPNSKGEPDYLGWELKQFNARSFEKFNTSVITLITPEPDGGYYETAGVKDFLHKYGYPDRKIANRINFGGIFKNEITANKTGLKLVIKGYDLAEKKITDANGGILIIDKSDNIASSWSFSSLLGHWNKKHLQAAYIPSQKAKDLPRRYRYSNIILLGQKTDFSYFLEQLTLGHIYYDPAIKLENIDTKPQDKRRSQFRIKSGYIENLYENFEKIDLRTI